MDQIIKIPLYCFNGYNADRFINLLGAKFNIENNSIDVTLEQYEEAKKFIFMQGVIKIYEGDHFYKETINRHLDNLKLLEKSTIKYWYIKFIRVLKCKQFHLKN